MTHKEKQEWLSKIDDVISALDEARSEVEDFSELVDDRIEENPDFL